ncbi:MAG: hypothetical protein AAFZ05_11895, partial [Pseudomonadota bacterium]
PQIADPQSMIFSPPMLSLAALNPQPSLQAIDATVLATVLFGGVGVLAYARHARLGWIGGLVGALVFMFGASMAWRLQHFGQIMSLAYVPFAIVCLRLAIIDGRRWAGIAAGVLGAAVLLGRDQVGLLAVYTLGAYAIYLLARTPVDALDTRGAKLRRSIIPLGAGAVVGVLLIAIPVTLTLLLADQSNRPTIDLDGAGAGSLHPALLITLVTPNLFGAAGEMRDYWGPPSFAWEDTGLFIAQNMGVLYLGMLPLAALVYAAVTGAAFRRDAIFFTAAAATMLIYALGWFTPLFALAYEVVPGVDKFRRPADATFLVGGFLAFVIAHGVDHAVRRTAEPLVWPRIIALVGSGVAVIAIALALAASMGRTEQAWLSLVTALGALAISAIAIAIARGLVPIRPGVAGTLIALVVAGDLWWHNGPNGATALPTKAIDMLQPAEPHSTVVALRKLIAADRAAGVHPRVEMLGLGYHWANASLTHSLPNTLGSNPVRLSHYVRATGAPDYVPGLDGRKLTPLMPNYASPFARMLGVKYVVAGPDAAASDKLTGFTQVSEAGGKRIFAQETIVPRALFAANSIAVDFDKVLRNGTLPIDDPTTTVALRDNLRAPQPNITPVATSRSGSATITSETNTTVDVAVEAPAGGWVVLHDVWHPWWTVTVDGAPADLLRANVIFRAVRVPAGAKTVRFVFRPFDGAWRQLTEGDR